MRKPKPPSLRTVSATLRYAGFGAIGNNGTEGYEVMWWGATNAAVYVSFTADDGDNSTAAHAKADIVKAKALDAMAATLRNKGWDVEEKGCSYLIVREQLEASRG